LVNISKLTVSKATQMMPWNPTFWYAGCRTILSGNPDAEVRYEIEQRKQFFFWENCVACLFYMFQYLFFFIDLLYFIMIHVIPHTMDLYLKLTSSEIFTSIYFILCKMVFSHININGNL